MALAMSLAKDGNAPVFPHWAAGLLGTLLAGLSSGAASAQDQCSALIEAACLQTLGAGSTPAPGGGCDAQLTAYRDCLAGVAAATPSGGRGERGGSCSDATALALWEDAKSENDCLGYETFLEACPAAPQARFAAARVQRLNCGAVVEPRPVVAAPEPAAAPSPAQGPEALHRDAQTELKRLGLYSSGVDGDWGAGSQRAMRAFQQREGMPVNGAVSAEALDRLRAVRAVKDAPAAPKPASGAPWLGVKIQDLTAETAGALRILEPAGALIVDFAPNSPATGALRNGDVILKFDGYLIGRARDVAAVVRTRGAGDRVEAVVFRNGALTRASMTLGTAP